MSSTVPAGDHVAFGFRLHGVPQHGLTRVDQPDWPMLHVHRRIGPSPGGRAHVGTSSARLSLGAGDWLQLERAERAATYLTTKPIEDDTLIHPRLAPAAALMARWLGREAFHAAAVLADGGAWALAGGNEAGKSTILASLAACHTPVLTDDLLVVDRAGLAYAGPRCIDLRQPLALPGPADDQLREVREGTRRRMDLPAVAATALLRGWIFLEWGTRVEATPCPPGARLGRLMAQRRWAVEAIDPRALLDLAALPAWTLRRPRGAAHMPAVLDLLRELAGGAQPARRGPARRAPYHPAAA